MAPTLVSPSSAISRAAPAVSPWTSGAKRCFFRKLRHCDSAWTWLFTVLMRFQRGAGQRHQAVLDALEMLGDDLEPGVRQQAVQVGDAAGDRILDRDHRQLGLAGLDRGHGRLEGRARQGRHVGKGRTAGHVGVGAGFALEGDGVAGHALVAAGCPPLCHLVDPPNARRLPIVGGLFRPPDHPRQSPGDTAPKSEKPRNIRHLRRSAARARGRDRILLAALRACYSNVRNFGRFGI